MERKGGEEILGGGKVGEKKGVREKEKAGKGEEEVQKRKKRSERRHKNRTRGRRRINLKKLIIAQKQSKVLMRNLILHQSKRA